MFVEIISKARRRWG